MNLQELMAKRANLVSQARSILDKAEGESRALSSEEQVNYDKILSDVQDLSKSIEAKNKQIELERSLADVAAQEKDKAERKGESRTSAQLLEEAARSFIQNGSIPQEAYNEWRDLQAGSNTEGGYLVMPELFVNQLIKFVDDLVTVRRLATVFQVPNAESLGAPSLDNDPDDAEWTVELATGSEDSTMSFGKRQLTPHAFAKRIKVSRKLINKALINPETLVMQRLAYKFGITEEKGYLTGSGAGQPLGLFTASSQGISTSRDISTDNTTTSITFDGLINAKYSVKGSYHANGKWMFHRDALKQISKLKDGNSQYIWQASVTAGRPDTILGQEVIESEYVPNTFTTGQYVGMYGDFSNYWIADAMNMQVQRLEELYAETNQIGFIGRKESDGMPVLEEAFARITLA